ncbi:PAS domain-containing protein [Pedobacter heparinus]|uniref:PAS sensor protein n=1 Tax=Pedobacter heparinus (strain ATCC 13125 / DSM 2366 / CIP 104194 / JCM 7457 / NBRC 12017 / NCIMB 9290 / NRRL B-14731 / HIM 762-3) TaxID=485917 RepID=C6XSE5_PEDHD|nr:PAS domain-containing protein [Pedobacter heparinus]ACU03490.1 PAS sensor protein [Pedobacter heparinus DSM 2366]
MFHQNILIVRESVSDNDKNLINLLLNIGYEQSQIVSVPAQKIPFVDCEVIFLLTEAMEQTAVFIPQINTDFPDVPLILIIGTTTAEQPFPVGTDDWLLESWLQPLLLKKTIQLAIERKQNTCNYLSIFRENPSPMYIYEKGTFQFLEANTAALRQYGYTREEFLELTAKDIRPVDELEAFYKINEELPAAYSNAGIWQHIRKNGEIFYVHIFTHQIRFAGKICKLVTAIDIDVTVKAENALKKKAKEIENILESITDGFFTVNRNWELTYINKAFEKIIQTSRIGIIGKNLWEYFPEARDLAYFQLYQKALSENVSVHFEEFYPPLNIWLSVNAYPTDSGLAVYFTDNTAQQNYQHKIEVQNKKFKEIAWVQAHQIRGPVSNLLGLVDLFNIEPDDPDNLELLARVKHTAIQMDESIKEIVHLTRKIES